MKKVIVLDDDVKIQLEIYNSDIEWESISEKERNKIEKKIDKSTIKGDLDGYFYFNYNENRVEIFWDMLFEDEEN
jgi:hypothetical protein